MIAFLDKGRTRTRNYYSTLLEKKLWRGNAESCPKSNGEWHISMQTIRHLGFDLLEPPPHSADLVPFDYHVLLQLNKNLKGLKFSSNEEVTEAVESKFAEEDKILVDRFRGVAGSL